MANLVITIDGPAASGKSTVARLLAGRLGADFLDTGAMYRAVTLAAIQAGVDLASEQALLEVLGRTVFDFRPSGTEMLVSIDGVDVTERIRDPDITANARYIASAPEVRRRLVEMQRSFAAECKKVVTEGRDQGTVAFDDADFKFFLTADLAERARRRQKELAAKGIRQSFEQIQEAIAERDKSDQSRAVGPLRPADDAIVVDTTNLTIDQVVDKLLDYIKCDA